jgi:hypothetical protein
MILQQGYAATNSSGGASLPLVIIHAWKENSEPLLNRVLFCYLKVAVEESCLH